ncbi:MAG: serine protease [Patescibacteria group bacterium]|jgi:hypothetical protein
MDPKSFTEQLLFSTVLIRMLDVKMQPFGHGTGFLYLLDLAPGGGQQKILLVSNKHVLNKCRAISIDFHAQQNNLPILDNVITVQLRYDDVWHHDTADVACIDITESVKEFQERIYIRCVGEDSLLDSSDELLDVHQDIFFVGYPLRIYDKKNYLPIVRSGITASHPNIPFNGKPEFIIDASVYEGSSGSPVFLDLLKPNLALGKLAMGAAPKCIGIISTNFNVLSELKEVSLPSEKLASSQVVGLATVCNSQTIREVVGQVSASYKLRNP